MLITTIEMKVLMYSCIFFRNLFNIRLVELLIFRQCVRALSKVLTSYGLLLLLLLLSRFSRI